MQNFITELKDCLQTGFIDQNVRSKRDYLPQLLVNDKEKKEKVLSTILRELEYCDEFWFSVAFVTKSGVAAIINQLNELRRQGKKGKILVSQYQDFTEPEALRALLQFENLEVRIVVLGAFHAKGYVFRRAAEFHLIIGSSNLTAAALCSNKEWNLKVSSSADGHLIHSILEDFNVQFKTATPVTDSFIDGYQATYDLARSRFLADIAAPAPARKAIEPNKMQMEALENLRQLRLDGKTKALLISATGTGKTYLCALDVREHKPARVLFIVHRGNIAKKSMESFRDVLGSEINAGLYSGQMREAEADYVFSTVQTISQSHHLHKFQPDHFDYVVIDETHRSGAESYQKILSYLKPRFLLGMSATPERTDGFDIFSQFDNNVAYEIRLHRALEEEMLCNFHYYGVTDVSVDNKVITEESAFNLLVANERVARIIEAARFYGCDSGIVRGLIFCSKVDECAGLSTAFNEIGYRTVALSGSSTVEERQSAIDLLESEDLTKKLHYIFTVDIFNEGIDIPKVNQIIMLRPTQSAIIFVQQLGRGLRKASGKDHLTIIDFIGNYYNNYLVPIALFGDMSYNKDSIRKLIKNAVISIPGASTVNFDAITKDRIFKAIDSASLNLRKDLTADYKLLKSRLGRKPMMVDFIENQFRDPFVFVEVAGSYLNFASQTEKEIVSLNEQETFLMKLFSLNICNGKRIEEIIIMKQLLSGESASFEKVAAIVIEHYDFILSKQTFESCEWNLNFSFVRKAQPVVKFQSDEFHFDPEFLKSLKKDIFRRYLIDALDYAALKFGQTYSTHRYFDGFQLYQKYSRRDVCRILNWEKDESATVYGYKAVKGSCPIFVTYHKSDEISSTTRYEEEFVNPTTFQWMSKSKRKLNSPDIAKIKSGEFRLPLFIKKTDGESSDFYYMGDVTPFDNGFEQTSLIDDRTKKPVPVVKVSFEMHHAVEDSIYNYLVS